MICLGSYLLFRRKLAARGSHIHSTGSVHELQPFGRPGQLWYPVLSVITVLIGILLTAHPFAATHINLHPFSKEKLGPLLFVAGLGLLLGMRHSTDADHVVAISTIVSNQRSIRNAAMIGAIWGLGHTITIFIVGSLIILFGIEIPPRLGLSMEFSVAIMLILLGILNLTGVMQKFTTRFSGASILNPASTTSRFSLYQGLRPSSSASSTASQDRPPSRSSSSPPSTIPSGPRSTSSSSASVPCLG
ncbi:hypothetical protein [Granulicella arctica]|uniref:hypothetical protein n=1 Tax=Granulicella arctica TaxID=940613 RepID=UPI0021DFC607|nr:hypothetical protein [Granulicella arctica]